MKPMEMAEALFGKDDGTEDATEETLDGSVDGESMVAATGFAPQGKNASSSTASKKEVKLGPPMDLAAAREEALKNGTAPAHYVEAAARRATGVASSPQTTASKAAKAGVPASVVAAAASTVKARKGTKAPKSASSPSKAVKSSSSSRQKTTKTASKAAGKAKAKPSVAGRAAASLEDLSLLGSATTRYPVDYDPSVLETFENKHPDNDYFVKFNCPEFTSLCPLTGQPDFATVYISYVPGARMVESKSLKLYLFSFRNHGDFHEDCINIIMKDLIALMDPKYIEVWGKFTPRGGISIDPFANYGKPGTVWEEVAWERLTHHDLYPEKVDNR